MCRNSESSESLASGCGGANSRRLCFAGSRLIVFEDLAGVPQIVKSTSIIFGHKKSDEPPLNHRLAVSRSVAV